MGKHKKVDFRRLSKSPARIPVKGFDVEALLHSELRSPTKQDPPALYILVSRQQVLYVGETISLKRRIVDHKTDKHFDTVFYWAAPQDPHKRLAQERRLIAKLRPPLNVYGLRGTDRRRLRRMPNTPRIQQEIECWALARNEVERLNVPGLVWVGDAPSEGFAWSQPDTEAAERFGAGHFDPAGTTPQAWGQAMAAADAINEKLAPARTRTQPVWAALYHVADHAKDYSGDSAAWLLRRCRPDERGGFLCAAIVRATDD